MFDSADMFRLSSRYICTDTLIEVLLIPLMSLFSTSSPQNNISLLSQVGITLDGSKEALVVQNFFQLVEGQHCHVR
jgi:hypothetical protein